MSDSALSGPADRGLLSPFRLRSRTFRNRAWLSPMCQYWAPSRGRNAGVATDWHLVHLGSRAVGGVGLVMAEATAVSREGRLTAADLGLWNDRQAQALARLAQFVREQGAEFGVQLAHAGRKGSITRPWEPGTSLEREAGGWRTFGPSAEPYPAYRAPAALDRRDILRVLDAFRLAARRAAMAGCTVLEIHGGHGYLIHQFLSPVSNKRTDGYGGDFAGRVRFAREVVSSVREEWPDDLPLFFRLSATDWLEEHDFPSWTLEESVELADVLKREGVDLIDVSSGGNAPAEITPSPGYQVPFAERIRHESQVPVAAVGLITRAEQAQAIVSEQRADAVFIGRELLRNPYWVRHASRQLDCEIPWEPPYERAG